MSEFIAGKFRDRLAIFLSTLCVVQCLFLPIIVTFLPFLDMWWLSDAVLHPTLLVFVVPLTFYALVPERNKHRSNLPLKLAIPGLLMLFAGVFMHQTMLEKGVTVIGALLLAAAHVNNIILSRKYRQTERLAQPT